MRVALLSCNAQAHNAIGNQVAAKAAFFQERGAEVRVFLQHAERLHPELTPITQPIAVVEARGAAWEYLSQADFVIADYAQYHDLLHFLPLLAGHRPRLIFDYHGVTPAQHWQGAQRELAERSLRERGFVWCADFALAHSQFAKNELQRATRYPAERILVQPYPTDLNLFRPGSGVTLRHRLGLDDGPVLLYVGRLAPSKRVPLLIEALPHVPKAQAVIVGDTSDVYGEEVRCCRETAHRLGVADRVHFLGQLDDCRLVDVYRAADVLVMPSLHEGYCLPAVEAMACGLPVVAARTSALPETIGDAGLSFAADDVVDLARKVVHALRARTPTREASRPQSVAVVAFRFGSGIVGGAERSLRTMAQTLQCSGQRVEVFTTCTTHESAWANDLPAGMFTIDGLTVHRFPIDVHDRSAHHDSIRRLLAADGRLDGQAAAEYLRHSIHSTSLIEALQSRHAEFDAIITGPYLFGLTHDVATTFPEKTLLVPCFHDEPFVRLPCWLNAYSAVGGVLYHSPEEQEFAQSVVGLNHPRAIEIGTRIDVMPALPRETALPSDRYVVYCGRYSQQKNLPLVLEYAERYQRERPGRFRFVFVGHGEVEIPRTAWAIDRGRVDEEAKRQMLARAAALVQLSRQESLSLVALEAWAQGTPVIVHRDCAVLRGQVERAQGGRAVGGYDEFARALDELWEQPATWRTLGESGRAYARTRYGDEASFRERLSMSIESLQTPLGECMRQRGLARASLRDWPHWRERFGQFIERVLDDEPRNATWDFEVTARTTELRTPAGSQSTLVPVRLVNHGALPALVDGPARTRLVAEVIDSATGELALAPSRTELPVSMVPGETRPAMIAVAVPTKASAYQLALYAEFLDGKNSRARKQMLTLRVGGYDDEVPAAAPTGTLLESIQAALAEAHRLGRLPDDYVDVTQGRFARWKRWLKQKLLGNFKKGYVDVLSRQQSQVNQNLLLSVQQLAEYCATLEHAVQTLQRKMECGLSEIEPSRNEPLAAVSRRF